MANILIFNICLLVIISCAESCFMPSSRYLLAAVALAPVSVAARGRTFSAWNNEGPESEMEVHLVRRTVQESYDRGKGFLKRSKRRWSPPPFNIRENDRGPFPKNIEVIVSDSEANYDVYYTISGPGVDEVPVGVFSLDRKTGMLTMHKAVDREVNPQFKLTVRAHHEVSHADADLPLDITIEVDDENDNFPQFTNPLQFTVVEQTRGEVVGLVNATDKDKPGSDHVDIRFSLLNGRDMFAINSFTGVITTITDSLDREVKDKHLVTVEIKDMKGKASGLATTGTATITLLDINDNPPTFTKTSYDVSVKENEKEQLVLRIPVEDKDLINTPNWISKFVLTKGNENGNFRVDTDPKTNEGLLYVTKPLDYEKNKNIKLELSARNQAELKGTQAKWLTIPVDVNVINVDEGPEFTAPTVTFTVKENIPNGTLIGTYEAVDPETNSKEGITYYKTADPAGWISVDRNNGELKVVNTIDRESHFVQDGVYNITMKAIDTSSKTGTGTVIILVEDVNDNIPEIPTSELVVCEKEGEHGSVIVVAEDNDDRPFSSPFTFNLPPDHDGKWSLTRYNDTAAVLKHVKELPTGIHDVPMIVTDLQGSGTTQTAKVRICQCRNGVCLAKDSSVSLGPLGLLALLLPLALLLLLCLLLAFFCVTKREKMELEDTADSGGILLKSNTEAPGDEVDSSLITVPTLGVEQPVKGSVKGSMMSPGWLGNKSSSTIGGHSVHENGIYKTGVSTANMQEFYSGQYDSQFESNQQFGGQLLGAGMGLDYRQSTQDSAFLHTWQTNGRYLHQKLGYLGTEENGRYADDILHTYGFEGVGSAAGSVGCCSDHGDIDNLDFINTLGPKFKTLAEVCRKT